jgi:glucuronokinase
VAEGFAPARTALAGNPSDGYGGAVLAVTLDGLGARVVARPSARLSVWPESELVRAATRRAGGTAAIQWSTTVPIGVGLGGSSAIAIATLRALTADLSPRELALTAHAVEREDLGIAGGRQDQLVQAYGGLVLMDWSEDPEGRVERLDPALLLPLIVAWRHDASEPSGIAHADLRSRYRAGDMPELAQLAHAARNALKAADHDTFARAVDESFEHRAAMMKLDPRHVEMIEAARAAGAAANYSGSGGAIVAVCRDDKHRAHVAAGLERLGCETLTVRA